MNPFDCRLDGAPNFRDIGGVSSADGRRMLRGRVFRSEVLNRLSAQDLELLRPLRIAAVCDLRHGVERGRQLNRWPEGCEPALIGLPPGEGLEAVQANGLQERLGAVDFDLDEARAFLKQGYRRMPRALADAVAAVFDHLLQADAAPLLIHCSAGKDRSGFVCAMLLTALDVSREAILQDYLLSRERYPQEPIRQALRQSLGDAVPAGRLEALVEVASVSADYLDAAFEQIAIDYGSVDTYLRDATRLDADRRQQLRERLLQQVDAAAGLASDPAL